MAVMAPALTEAATTQATPKDITSKLPPLSKLVIPPLVSNSSNSDLQEDTSSSCSPTPINGRRRPRVAAAATTETGINNNSTKTIAALENKKAGPSTTTIAAKSSPPSDKGVFKNSTPLNNKIPPSSNVNGGEIVENKLGSKAVNVNNGIDNKTSISAVNKPTTNTTKVGAESCNNNLRVATQKWNLLPLNPTSSTAARPSASSTNHINLLNNINKNLMNRPTVFTTSSSSQRGNSLSVNNNNNTPNRSTNCSSGNTTTEHPSSYLSSKFQQQPGSNIGPHRSVGINNSEILMKTSSSPKIPLVNNMNTAVTIDTKTFNNNNNEGSINNTNTNSLRHFVNCEQGRTNNVDNSVNNGRPIDLLAAQQQVVKFQCILEKKVNTLMKRLRRIQGKQLEQHIKRQLTGFVNKQHKNLQTMAKSIKSPPPNPTTNMTTNPGNNPSNPTTGLQTEFLTQDVRSLSTAALVNLVRKLQSPQPMSPMGQQRLSGHPNVSSKVVDSANNSILKLDKETCVESERVACQLNTVLRHMESSLDSDATESSSGGESCDDDEDYGYELKTHGIGGRPPPHLPHETTTNTTDKEKRSRQMSLHRRAEWKWAFDRSAIAFRWTWLQAQVSDLEYRIRQQSEVHKQIRSNKGAVNFDTLSADSERMARVCKSRTGKPPSSEGGGENKSEFSNINNTLLQTSKLTSPLENIIPPALSDGSASLDKTSGDNTSTKSLNGLIDKHSGNISEAATNASSTNLKKNDSEHVSQNSELSCSPAVPVDITCQAARCRPVKSYRKRKILRTTGLHLLSQKATRLSTVKCHCYAPVIPCAMCGGRYNNTQSLDPDLMPLHERVSLLDPAFHPVLSFSQEIPLPVHFEALLKSGEWQIKPPPKPTKAAANDRRRQKILQQNEARRTSKKLKNAAAVLLSSAKFRSRYDKKPVQKSRPSNATSAAVNSMNATTPSSLPSTPQNKVTDKRSCRTEIKKRRAAQLAIALKKFPSRSLSLGGNRLSGKRRFRSADQAFLKDGSSPFNCPSATFKEMKEATLRKRRGESAFDINNIVIPYSMAASTRVEKLQYKEIVTPKWRKIENQEANSSSEPKVECEENSAPSTTTITNSSLGDKKQTEAATTTTPNQTNGISSDVKGEDEEDGEEEEEDGNCDGEVNEDELEIEDLSDELYIQRHAKCEIQEKKRFVSFFKHGRRGHRSVRSDDTEPVSPESAGALDGNSMIGSPIHPLTSSRHGPCADALASTLSNQSPSPLPTLLPLQDRSTSLNHPSPNNKLNSELTENQTLLATLDETDKMKHGVGRSVSMSYNPRQTELEDSDNPHMTAGYKQQDQSCLLEGGVSSHLLSRTASNLVHRSQSPLLSKLSQNTAALSANHSSTQSYSPSPSPTDTSIQVRPLTPTFPYPCTYLQRFYDEQLGRRRCSSLSKHERSCFDDDTDLFDMQFEHLTVEPWVHRTFPLDESEYESMQIEQNCVTQNSTEPLPESSQLDTKTLLSSHPCSPIPGSSSASVPNMEEDPNDPEWKVIGSKSGMVLRLAKR